VFSDSLAFINSVIDHPAVLAEISALRWPWPVALGLGMATSALMNLTRVPNPWFSLPIGFAWGPMLVKLIALLVGITPIALPGFFAEPWWLVALVPMIAAPKMYDWGRTGSPVILITGFAIVVGVIGALASLADALT
jgi:hypothetical protein